MPIDMGYETPDEKVRNHKFWLEKDEIKSRPASKKELKELRETCDHSQWMTIGRSCFLCNYAHLHLIDMDYLNCFSCGRFFRKGVDITIYEDEDE